MQRWAIIIPCYNEETGIKRSVEDLAHFLKGNIKRQWVVCFVDDGSVDDTAEVLHSAIGALDQMAHVEWKVLKAKENSGKGAAIQMGVSYTSADAYCYMDADLSIDYKAAFAALPTDADLVLARREERREYSGVRQLGSGLFGLLARRLFGLPYTDIQCGWKWFRAPVKETVLAVQQKRFSFDLELIVRARKAAYRIQEVDVQWKHSSSSSVLLRDGVRYLLDLLSIAEIGWNRKRWISATLITSTLITAIFFGWTLFYGFFFSDDFTWLWHGSKILRGEISWITAHMSTFYSPVLNAFYAVMMQTVGPNAWAYFLFGLGVHVTAAVLLGRLGAALLKSEMAGFIAAVLFAFAGSAYEPLVWIGANMHSVVCLFMLLSAWALWVAMQSQKKRSRWLLLSLAGLIGAFGTKEVAFALPPILALLLLWHIKETKRIPWKDWWYWVLVTGLSGVYAWKQYITQRQSVWVSGGAFRPTGDKLGRGPLSLVDMMVPLKEVLDTQSAGALLFLSLVLLGYMLWRFRHIPAVWFGFLWAALAMAPVIFFNAVTWWELLPSRYTYTPRAGVALAIAAMVCVLLKQGKNLRVAHRFVWLLAAGAALHVLVTAQTMNSEYAYVYQTGVALSDISAELQREDPSHVYVNWFRPFTSNKAHVVGAFDILAGISEEEMTFLEAEEEVLLQAGEVEVRWNDSLRQYYLQK